MRSAALIVKLVLTQAVSGAVVLRAVGVFEAKVTLTTLLVASLSVVLPP